ncbi:MAG: DNA polymerase I, partial [Oscillospiraceae bacterium]|nr:DNA polymerase I [Oscillospiraceae bacterium]
MSKILLIDGHSMLNRAFYGLPDLTNAEGTHTGAVYGFLNIMLSTIEEEKPDYLAVAFDLPAPTFRHIMFADYKGTRKAMPEELRQQVPLTKEMLAAMGVPIVMKEGYEADDILGTLALRSQEKGMEVTILSGDRDLLQLATDKIKIRMPKTSRGQTTIENYHATDVVEKYQVTPTQIIELKALMGDSSDNIPGLPGVGEKTATKLILSYGTIENAHAHLEEIKPNRAREAMRDHFDLAQLSKDLATIRTDSPVDYDYEEFHIEKLFTEAAYDLCKRLDFRNFLPRFQECNQKTNALEDSFFLIEDTEGVEMVFSKLLSLPPAQGETLPCAGLCLLAQEGELLGLGLALDREEIYYIPASPQVEQKDLIERIAGTASRVCYCVMDVKSVLKTVSLQEGDPVFDVGLAAYLVNLLKSDYQYHSVAREFLSQDTLPSREELLGKLSLISAREKEEQALARLASYSAYTALAAMAPLTERLKEEGMWDIYREIELPLAFVLDSMEKTGMKVKGEELKAYGEKLTGRIRDLEQEIYRQAGEEFNINSPKQLGVILFEKLGLKGGKKTKTGYSTAADILEKLAEDQPVVKDILEYRTLTKLKSTYADGLFSQIASDGRIHSTFNQTITATGRISSTEPNLQNIPVRMELGRLIRKVFVPEEGCVFLDADYSQIELRVLAHMSQDEKLIQAYREAQDIHRLTASEVFHVPF